MTSKTVFCSSPFRIEETEFLPPLFPNASALLGKHYRDTTNCRAGTLFEGTMCKKSCLMPAGSQR